MACEAVDGPTRWGSVVAYRVGRGRTWNGWKWSCPRATGATVLCTLVWPDAPALDAGRHSKLSCPNEGVGRRKDLFSTLTGSCEIYREDDHSQLAPIHSSSPSSQKNKFSGAAK